MVLQITRLMPVVPAVPAVPAVRPSADLFREPRAGRISCRRFSHPGHPGARWEGTTGGKVGKGDGGTNRVGKELRNGGSWAKFMENWKRHVADEPRGFVGILSGPVAPPHLCFGPVADSESRP